MKRYITLILSLILLFTAFGCGSKNAAVQPAEEKKEPEKPAVSVVISGDFNETARSYLSENGFQNENYIFSPLSLRAALCLAIEGADGKTREGLIQAAGFDSYEDVLKWYVSVAEKTTRFREALEQENALLTEEMQYMPEGSVTLTDRAFEIANAVFNNKDVSVPFKKSYEKKVAGEYGADVRESSAASISDDVNGWVNEKTKGMIPKIVGDISGCAAVLANALYLRSSWIDSFPEHLTKEDDFTCFDGSVQKKEFLEDERSMTYYEDENTQIAVIPMDGDLQYVMVLGSTDNLLEKIKDAKDELVHLRFPKLDVESTFDEKTLNGFLTARGAGLAFDSANADFGNMADTSVRPWYIDSVIQKAKIRTDEEGLEATAATVIMMAMGAFFVEDWEPPKEFIANRPFSFYVFSELNGEQPEMLFMGQVVR